MKTYRILQVSLIALLLVLRYGGPLRAQTTSPDIFIEAESSPHTTFNEPAAFPGLVSGDRMLRLWKEADPPPDGYFAEYPFTAAQAQDYHVWVAASLPPSTSSFWWRLDDGAWGHITPDTADPVQTYGVSNVMGWIELTRARLAAGPHTLTIRVNERRDNNEHAYLLYLDAVLITPRDVFPHGLVTPADLPRLMPKPPPPVPVPRAGKPGPPMLLGTSVMSDGRNRLVRSLGFTLSQTDSDHLTTNEVTPGHWDWTHADAELAACRRAGLRWQYFPHFHWAPEWYRKTARFVPCTGLRSRRTLPCISIWSPDIVPWFDHGYAAMTQHYGGGPDPVAAIYLGVHGDFGETIFPMGWHPDEKTRFPAENLPVPDFWCGDASARADFRRSMQRKYGTVFRLNSAWGTNLTSFDAVDYPPTAYNGATPITQRRYWLDFIGWYYDSMTRFTGEVCRIARKYFPQSLLMLPVGGGSENLLYAQDTTAIPRIAKQYGVHIRSTHGGYAPFPDGYAGMIKRIATPCKIYGVPHWLEPPGGITPEGEVSRFMEALSCGNWAFWDWGNNPVAAADTFREYQRFFTREQPVVDVALFFPTTDHRLHPETDYPPRLHALGTYLRDVMDYDIVDEELMADGGLDRYRVLLWVDGTVVEEQTLRRVAAWVERGGTLLWCGAQPMQTVEGDSRPGRALLGLSPQGSIVSAQLAAMRLAEGGPAASFLRHREPGQQPMSSGDVRGLDARAVVLATAEGRPAAWAVRRGKGWVIGWAGVPDREQTRRWFAELARDAVYNLSRLDPTKADAREVDRDWDGVYTTLLANGEALLHNFNTAPRTVTIGSVRVTLPPKSLRAVVGGR